MTVAQLMTILAGMPGDMPVVFRSLDHDFTITNGKPMVESVDISKPDDFFPHWEDCLILCSDEPVE